MHILDQKNKYKIFSGIRVLFASLLLVLLSVQSFPQNNGMVWGINLHNDVWKWDGSNWQKIYGSLTMVTVGSNDNVWGIAPNNDIYKWNGSSWSLIEGKLKGISAGADDETWGVSPQNDIYRYTGNGWQKIEGKLKEVAVGGKNVVFGVDPNDNIWKWTGRDWEKCDGILSNISVAADGSVWGIDSNGVIWRYRGNGWEKVNGSLSQVSAGGANLAWGVTKTGDIYRYYNGNWKKMPGNLISVSIGSSATSSTTIGGSTYSGKKGSPKLPAARNKNDNSNSIVVSTYNLYDEFSETNHKSLYLSSSEVNSTNTKLKEIQARALRNGCYKLVDQIDDVKKTLSGTLVSRSTLKTKLRILYDSSKNCK